MRAEETIILFLALPPEPGWERNWAEEWICVYVQVSPSAMHLKLSHCWSAMSVCVLRRFSSVVSDSLWPHESQHASPPCPSPTPRIYPNSCPLSQYAIQPSRPLSSPSPLALNLFQDQGLFQWISSSHQVAKVLDFQLQHQSYQSRLRTDLLEDRLVGSPCCPRDSQESSPTPQFFGAQLSL